jgi:cytochrome c biogenesis protein CcmG/thiol:disulfide interchange protein DsbE
MRRPGAIVIVVLAALLVGLLIYGVTQQGDDRNLEAAIKNGKRPSAPDARLPRLSGSGTQTLADYRGQVVVLNFWASWCDPCAEEAPILEDLEQRLGDKGTVLGVTYKDYAADSRAFMRRHRLTYPSLRDDKLTLSPKYGTTGLPETFVLDKQGRIVAISRGTVTSEFLDNAVKKALRS